MAFASFPRPPRVLEKTAGAVGAKSRLGSGARGGGGLRPALAPSRTALWSVFPSPRRVCLPRQGNPQSRSSLAPCLTQSQPRGRPGMSDESERKLRLRGETRLGRRAVTLCDDRGRFRDVSLSGNHKSVHVRAKWMTERLDSHLHQHAFTSPAPHLCGGGIHSHRRGEAVKGLRPALSRARTG